MNRRSLLIASSALLGAGTLARHAHAQGTVAITGAGATFPAPVYAKWGEAASGPVGIQLNYQAIGSGGGQNQIRNRTVDFGASDAPLTTQQLDEAKLLQFPTVMGSVVPIVNIPGVSMNQLRLTGEVLADIYRGEIAKWNDRRITELNQGVNLPNLAIAPVYRADGSGTTFVFTSYLSAASSTWKGSIGANTSIRWPAGTGARGNDGVAGTVHNVRGAIGYVENAYATQNKLITVQLRNKAGQFVAPTMAAFQAAASAADWKAENFAPSLIDQDGAATWPIVSPTFILLPKNPQDAGHSMAVMKFFDWAFRNGGQIASSLEYIPLPQSAQDAIRAAWKSEIKGPDGKAIWNS